MKILHLSDTQLSGSPDRIVKLINKYTDHEARHLVWNPKARSRKHPVDIKSIDLSYDEVSERLDWADIIHFHNRWQRQEVLDYHGFIPPKKPSVIQIHSPRESEDFSEELASGIPLAIVGQYQPRQWEKELTFIVPNVVDIHSPDMMPTDRGDHERAFVSFAPSSTNGHGWDDKGHGWTNPILKRWKLEGYINYKLIHSIPWDEAMIIKQGSDIGIDEMQTGSYHLSGLEYLSMGVATYCHTDEKTEAVIKDMTGASYLPWINCTKETFKPHISDLINSKGYEEVGRLSRVWMEEYWSPEFLVKSYMDMYEKL